MYLLQLASQINHLSCKLTFFQVKGKGKMPSWSTYNSVSVNGCSDHETALGPVRLCHFKLQWHPQRRRVMNHHPHTSTSILPIFLSKTQKAKQTRLLSQIKIDCTAFYRWRCGGIMHYNYVGWIKDKVVFMEWHCKAVKYSVKTDLVRKQHSALAIAMTPLTFGIFRCRSGSSVLDMITALRHCMQHPLGNFSITPV